MASILSGAGLKVFMQSLQIVQGLLPSTLQIVLYPVHTVQMFMLSYLIKYAVMQVNPHGLLLAQVDLKNIQLPPVEAIGALLQSLAIYISVHSFLSLHVVKAR